MLNRLLLHRLVIFNACVAFFVLWCFSQGYVQALLAEDKSYISYGIIALFLAGMFSLLVRAKKVSDLLDTVKKGEVPLSFSERKFKAKQWHLVAIQGGLVMLGLIGTVVGFKMAVGALDMGAAGSSASSAKSMVTELGAGVAVALNTTILGSILALWMEPNIVALRTATECAVSDAGDIFSDAPQIDDEWIGEGGAL